MKILRFACVIVILLLFAACSHNTADIGDDPEFKYDIVDSGGKMLTDYEKEIHAETHLAERLQATIELFNEVDDATVAINRTGENENERIVDVSVITKPGLALTDEQKNGIINIINDSISDDLTVIINLNAE